MSYFCVPEHIEHTHCDCITSSGTKCSRQAKYRFVYEHRVDYTCGIKSHMVPDKENRSSFFVQRKLTPKGKWTWLYTKCSESNPQDPTHPKKNNDSSSKDTQSLHETIRVQKNTIAIQKSAVESLQILVRQLKLLAERNEKNAKAAPVDEFQTKMHKATKDALRTATQELRWLFEELFKGVNV